jgi:hypothetical protein
MLVLKHHETKAVDEEHEKQFMEHGLLPVIKIRSGEAIETAKESIPYPSEVYYIVISFATQITEA